MPYQKSADVKFLKNTGPGTMVAAAFIGPGTVTVCTLAGNKFGFSLLWALLFAVGATIILQEMSARLGIITGKGLGEAIKAKSKNPILRILFYILIISAIFIGNAAYEAGNLSGARIGLELIFKDASLSSIIYNFLVATIVFVLLYFGNYKILEKFFITIVLLMSLSFIFSAIITKPSFLDIIKGLFIPESPPKSWMTIIALVGTTIVPYNLFLHAALVSKKWAAASELTDARSDLVKAIILGGLISMSIIIAGAASRPFEIIQITDLPVSLEPVFGHYARYFFGFGLFAAGITSTITAPLAAAFAVKGLMGWDGDMRERRFRAVWITILLTGLAFACAGYKPIQIIQFAQFTNGLLLPVIAGFLIWIVNQKDIMGDNINRTTHNIAAIIVVLICIGLGVKSIMNVF